MSGSEVRADFWMSEYITPWDIYVHGVIAVLAYKKTAYQEMYVVQTGTYGKGLVLDGKWQSCTGDEFLYHEPLVHPAMICHGSPKKSSFSAAEKELQLEKCCAGKQLKKS